MDIAQPDEPTHTDQPIAQTHEPTMKKPLRLWPGVAVVLLQWLLWFIVPLKLFAYQMNRD